MRRAVGAAEPLDDLDLDGELEDDWGEVDDPPKSAGPAPEQFVNLESLSDFESVGSGDATQWAAWL